MFEFVIMYSDYFVITGLTVFVFLFPIGFFSVRSLRKEITNQLVWKVCGSVGLLSFIGVSLMGLGMYLESLKDTPTEEFEYGLDALLATVICPGIFALISFVVMAISIWSYHQYLRQIRAVKES